MKINGFPNYSILEDGTITNDKTGRVLKHSIYNYARVTLMNNKKRKDITVHRLLGIHFIPNPDNKPMIDHINRNKLDNRLENLRWVTNQENCRNQNLSKKNKLGHKYISKQIRGGCIDFNINIHVLNFCRHYNIKNYTLEDVINIRNKVLEDNNMKLIE